MLRDPALIPLSHQHQHGLALSVLIERGLKADSSDAKASELQKKLAGMVELELNHHFEIEEKVLFPKVRPALGSGGIVDDLITQHRELQGLADSLAEARGPNRIRLLKAFGELLSRHIRIEERQLFEEVQQKLSAEEMKTLGKEIDEKLQKLCPVTDKLPWEQTD